jgi:uncharacterized membrane protein YfcA
MSAGLVALLAVFAFATATVSGVLGMAGGVTLLGLMTLVLPARDVVAVHGVVQLASNGSRALLFLRRVSWRLFLAYTPGLVVGITIATLALKRVEIPYFSTVIGVFLLAFLWWRRTNPTLRALPLAVYPLLGLVVGVVTLVFGATGPLIAPFFFRDDLEKEDVIATKAACQMVGHLLKVPAFLSLGFDYAAYAVPLVVLVVVSALGTYAGKHVLENMDRKLFDTIFQAVLVVLALILIVNGVR